MMSEKDIGVVCSMLNRLPEAGVQSLTKADIWWLPNIESVPKRRAIVSICDAIRSFDSARRRLSAIAWLYCCLAEKRVLKWWYAYCFDSSSSTVLDRFTLPDRLVSVLKVHDDCTVCEKVERDDAVYACIMTVLAPSVHADHNALCFCILRTLPYVFVHVLANRSKFQFFFERAVGRPIVELQAGHGSEDLGCAITKVHVGDVGKLSQNGSCSEDNGFCELSPT
ncbi:hypothetical protein MRX96_047281 [Rhipicephalus microplus]